MKTVVGMFDDFTQAKSAAADLESAGFAHSDISLVASNSGGQFDRYVNQTATSAPANDTVHAVGTDATAGAAVGGVVGLLMGLGLFVIPGFGPIVAAGWLASTIAGAGIGAMAGGLIGALTHVGVPHEDATYYNEGVRRGGTLLAVKAPDDRASEVARILSTHGAVNIDERAATYRQEGFLPTPASPGVPAASAGVPTPSASSNAFMAASAAAPPPVSQTTPATARNISDREVALPVVEEELQVGKREVERGGVRVYSHMTETPVEESVQLREEHVTIERRPVNRPASETDITAFKEGTVEIKETAEEPIISKQARIVEEVVVGKEATERTETVRDTVRRTDVDVEPLRPEHDLSRRTEGTTVPTQPVATEKTPIERSEPKL